MIYKYLLRDRSVKFSNEQLYSILLGPIITEKTIKLSLQNKITLKVSKDSNKIMIKRAVEKIFNIPVESVNTLVSKPRGRTFKGVKGKRSSYKKAVITVKKGFDMSEIDLYGSGVQKWVT